MKEIYFIRHGETEFNKLGKSQGCELDTSLNETGKEQSYITGRYLKEYRCLEKPFDIVFCSPMLRCTETAEIICKEINYEYNNVQMSNMLIERKAGDYSGTNKKDRESDPKFDQHRKMEHLFNSIHDPIERKLCMIPIFELCNKYYNDSSQEEMIQQLTPFIELLKSSEHQKILVITHSGVISCINDILVNVLDMDGIYTFGSNCAITYYQYQDTDECHMCSHQDSTTPNQFLMILPPNTLHFDLYKKNYSKIK